VPAFLTIFAVAGRDACSPNSLLSSSTASNEVVIICVRSSLAVRNALRIDPKSPSMMKRLLLCLLACLTSFSCHKQSPAKEDLIENLAYAEKVSDTQVVLFGTPAGKMLLQSGWWPNPEFDQGFPYRWIVSPKAAFVFYLEKPSLRYLHLQLKSFYKNPANIYINQKLVSRITVDTIKQDFTIPLAAEALVSGLNQIEMEFNEVRSPLTNSKDQRELAVAAYYAILTPAKYFKVPSSEEVQHQFWSSKRVQIGTKTYPALDCKQGGSIRYYQMLGKNPVLDFGYYYQPRTLAEDDDFAQFTIALRHAKREQIIFEKRLTEKGIGFKQLELSPYLAKDGDTIYEILFRIRRNSIFDNGKTAWVAPYLIQKSTKKQLSKSEEHLSRIRELNRRANVILVVLDAAASKHFSTYGYFRKTTPVTDQLAKEGVQFDSAYTQAVYTLASTASLMTGLFPFHHGVLYLTGKLPQDSVTMAKIFQRSGYKTGTFIANGNASSTFGLTQGFGEVAEVFREKRYTGWGQDVTNRFTGWLEKNQGVPFFAYLHYREPHAPFRPPREWIGKFVDPDYHGAVGVSMITAKTTDIRQKINTGEIEASKEDRDFIVALYDANLAYGDSQVGQVVKKVKELGIYDNTIIIVTSDHGEAFWEHGYSGHNVQLYQESIHIPLVIKLAHSGTLPSVLPRKINPIVRTIDLFPTLVDLLSFSRRGLNLDGRSYLPYLAGVPEDGRKVIAQTIAERSYAYLDGTMKYIVDTTYAKEPFPEFQSFDPGLVLSPGSVPLRKEEPFLRLRAGDLLSILPVDLVFQKPQEFYNLKSDPLELQNQSGLKSGDMAYYRSRLFEPLDKSRKLFLNQKVEEAVLDESTRENLRALGYIGQDSAE
jgi:arylsulfatase A-like enzyme